MDHFGRVSHHHQSKGGIIVSSLCSSIGPAIYCYCLYAITGLEIGACSYTDVVTGEVTDQAADVLFAADFGYKLYAAFLGNFGFFTLCALIGGHVAKIGGGISGCAILVLSVAWLYWFIKTAMALYGPSTDFCDGTQFVIDGTGSDLLAEATLRLWRNWVSQMVFVGLGLGCCALGCLFAICGAVCGKRHH